MSDETCGAMETMHPDDRWPCVRHPGHDGDHRDSQDSTWNNENEPTHKPHFIKRGDFLRGWPFNNAVDGLGHHSECDHTLGDESCHKDCPELWYERGRHDGESELKSFLIGRAQEVARRFVNGLWP